jgi:TRAP-type mannitol/chloroaromatic compound transport system permease small subunit
VIGLHGYWFYLLANPFLLVASALLLRAPLSRESDRLTEFGGQLVQIMDQISERIIELVKWFGLAMVLLTTLLVIGRYVFGIGSLKGQEIIIYLHAFLFLLAGSATLVHNGHVRVDVLYSKMNKQRQAMVDLAGSLLFLIPVCLTILIFSEGFVAMSWRVFESSPEADGLKLVYVLKSGIPTFAILMLLQGSAQALRAVLVLIGHPIADAKPHAELI